MCSRRSVCRVETACGNSFRVWEIEVSLEVCADSSVAGVSRHGKDSEECDLSRQDIFVEERDRLKSCMYEASTTQETCFRIQSSDSSETFLKTMGFEHLVVSPCHDRWFQ